MVTAFVYLASDPEPGLAPFDWYLALIVARAREHGFDRRRLRALLAVAEVAQGGGPGRDDAIEVLAEAAVGADVGAYLVAQADLTRPQARRGRSDGGGLQT